MLTADDPAISFKSGIAHYLKGNVTMKFNLAELENKFLIENREIVKLETVISKLQEKSNLPLEFILDELDKIKWKLQQKRHEVNVILIDRNKSAKIIFENNYFDEINSILYGNFITTFKLFFQQYNPHDIYETYYREKVKGLEGRIKFNYDELVKSLNETEAYLLKSDVETLSDEIQVSDDEVFFIPDYLGIDGNDSKDYQDEKEYNEFMNSGACDLAFDLWVVDKENYTANLTGLQQANARIAELLAENERLKAQIEQSQTDTKDYMLGSFIHPDPLAIALNVRLNEWGNYNHETGEGKKSATQIKNKIKKQYGINDTLAEQIERVACPIIRSRNK